MQMLKLGSLQLTLFAMMLVGALLKRKGILNAAGKKCLSDLCIQVVIPCNIFKSCLIDLDQGVLRSCGLLLISAIYLIPMRVVMWSVGTTYFLADAKTDRKSVLKNVLTHPCLVAVYLGLFCMVTQVQLPSVVLNTVRYIGSCNSALTMFVVGTILADVPLRSVFRRDTALFAVLRLCLLPVAALALGTALRLNPTALGVSVLMTGMPAGATAAIFAEKYGSDAAFATQCVVLTTLVSMLTLPLWAYLVG